MERSKGQAEPAGLACVELSKRLVDSSGVKAVWCWDMGAKFVGGRLSGLDSASSSVPAVEAG